MCCRGRRAPGWISPATGSSSCPPPFRSAALLAVSFPGRLRLGLLAIRARRSRARRALEGLTAADRSTPLGGGPGLPCGLGALPQGQVRRRGRRGFGGLVLEQTQAAGRGCAASGAPRTSPTIAVASGRSPMRWPRPSAGRAAASARARPVTGLNGGRRASQRPFAPGGDRSPSTRSSPPPPLPIVADLVRPHVPPTTSPHSGALGTSPTSASSWS